MLKYFVSRKVPVHHLCISHALHACWTILLLLLLSICVGSEGESGYVHTYISNCLYLRLPSFPVRVNILWRALFRSLSRLERRKKKLHIYQRASYEEGQRRSESEVFVNSTHTKNNWTLIAMRMDTEITTLSWNHYSICLLERELRTEAELRRVFRPIAHKKYI